MIDNDYRATKSTEEGLKVSVWNKPLIDTVKIIDFGGATYESEHHTTTINTR